MPGENRDTTPRTPSRGEVSSSTNDRVYEISDADLLPDHARVLVVEDDAQLTSLLSEHLGECGYEVVSVNNGADALRRILEKEFDVVLCDVVMPHLAGDMFYLAVERVRPQICKRFVFMTGHRGDPKIDSFMRKISGRILWKPFEIQQLMDAIEGVLLARAQDEVG